MNRSLASFILIFCFWAEFASAQQSISVSRSALQNRASNTNPAKIFKSLSAQWRLVLTGEDRKDEQSQAKTIQTRVDLKSRYSLTSNFYLNLEPSVRFESGQSQSYDGADKAENKFLMSEASANYRPLNYFSVSGGALAQQNSHTNLLIDKLAFPAAQIAIGPQAGAFKFFTFIESAIPTSTSLSTNTKELETTPGLDTVGAQLHWSNEQWLKIRALTNYFQYRNLPSAVAKDSQLLGNDVSKISEASYKFENEYAGIESSLEFIFLATPRTRLKLEAQYLLNNKAPSEVNSAYLIGSGFEYLIKDGYSVELKGTYYQVAPEAAVAYFNASGFETNRIGYRTEGFLNLRKQKFRLGLRYSEAETLYQSQFQSREKMVTVLVETFYVDI